MGFRTCALEKRSGEVLKLLAAVRVEFQKYGEAVRRRARGSSRRGATSTRSTRARARSTASSATSGGKFSLGA